MYDQFKNDEEMWELGKQRELALIRERSFKHEYQDRGFKKGKSAGLEEGKQIGLKLGREQGLAKGKELGLEEGILKEKKASCIKILEKRYQIDAGSWVEGLNIKQLDMILELVFETDEFDVLKEKIIMEE